MANAYDNKDNKNPYRIGDALKVLGIEGFTKRNLTIALKK